jgi:hypothetical protein
MDIFNTPPREISNPEWFILFYDYIHSSEDLGTSFISGLVEELDDIVRRMFLKITYNDWCEFLLGNYTVVTRDFISNILLWRDLRTIFVNETKAAAKLSKIQEVQFKTLLN